MERTITGYHLDDEGDWVAELVCGHNQHVRHRPPFQMRPWVLDAAGRSARRGSPLDCPLCDRAELPDDLRFVRSTPVWDERTLPNALRHAHRVAGGTWGRITVHQGRLRFRAQTHPPLDVVIEAGTTQAIPPDVEHDVAPLGTVRMSVDFLAVDRKHAVDREHIVPVTPVPGPTAVPGPTPVPGPTAVPGPTDEPGATDEGGDPACWAHLVDEESGTIEERP